MQTKDLDGQVSMFGPGLPCGRTCPAAGAVRQMASPARTSGRSLSRSSELKNRTLMLLDLRPGAGNMLGPYWEYDPAWLGRSGRLNTSACPKGATESSLSQILQGTVPSKYYLSRTACRGILRRATERGKPLPPQLEMSALLQAGLVRPPAGIPVFLMLRAAQLIAVREILSLLKTPDQCRYILEQAVREETHLFTAAFSAGAGSSAGSVGYQEEVSPTLKGSPSGSMMPTVLCLNDQGGKIMTSSENVTGTLRAQEHGHQPLILWENHGIDARYKGPLSVSPTLSARAGTGGLNTPLVSTFSQQRADRYRENNVASTESARQYKSATDLVLQPKQEEAPAYYLLRRLLPVEAERLQGFEDGWTDLPGASDSARFRALGNSVPIPCVEYLMQGIALVLRAGL